jgi:hypothetical protein
MLSNGQGWTLIGIIIGLVTFSFGAVGAMFVSLRNEMTSTRSELKAEIRAESADVRAEIATLRGEMHAGFADVNGRVDVVGTQVAALTDRVERIERR